MYEVGDKIFLTEECDRIYNKSNIGKEVDIIAIDRQDRFLPIGIRTKSNKTHWIGIEDIGSKIYLLGIKV